MTENNLQTVSKKESTLKKELIVFSITLLALLLVAGVSFIFGLVTLNNRLESSAFIGLEHYVRLFLEDDIFMTALTNTFLLPFIPTMIAVLVAWLLSVLLPLKEPKGICIYSGITFGIGLVMLIFGIVLCCNHNLITAILSGAFQVYMTDLKLFTQSATVMICVIIFLLSFGLCAGVFMLMKQPKFTHISRFFVRLGTLLLIWNGNVSISTAIASLVGYSSTNYAVGTIVHHLSDYQSTTNNLSVQIFGWIPSFILFFVIALSMWGIDRLLDARNRKKQEAA